jgi:hypothetical protein
MKSIWPFDRSFTHAIQGATPNLTIECPTGRLVESLKVWACAIGAAAQRAAKKAAAPSAWRVEVIGMFSK